MRSMILQKSLEYTACGESHDRMYNGMSRSLASYLNTYKRRKQPCAITILHLPTSHDQTRLPEERITKTNRYRLRLGVVSQRSLTQFTPTTALLVSTKWQSVVEHVVLVNPDGTSAEGIRDTDGGVQVAGVDSGGETVGGCVAEADGILFRLEFGDRADGAEDLFLHDLHVFADAGEDGGLDKVSLVSVTLATNFELGALFLAVVDVA